MGLYTTLAPFDTYDQSKRHPSEDIFIAEMTEQLHGALESDVITEPDYRHCCTQLKFIPLATLFLFLQQEYLDHLNHCTYPNGPILGAYFTMNLNVQPSAPVTTILSSNLYDTCADIISQRAALDADCDPNPNVQPQMHHSTTASTHCDSENQSTQRTIHVGDRIFLLPPTRTSMQPPTTLRQPAEQTENLMAQSDFSQVQNSSSHDSEKDNKTTPIVQRSRLQCDRNNTNLTTTTTPTTSTPLQLRNCAYGSVDCAAHPTTSTTTSTTIYPTTNFNDTFVYVHDRQQQRLPMYFNSLYFQIRSQVRKIDASCYIQRCRVIKILQLLTFGPDIEPEPPPTIPLVVSDHSKCLNQGP